MIKIETNEWMFLNCENLEYTNDFPILEKNLKELHNITIKDIAEYDFSIIRNIIENYIYNYIKNKCMTSFTESCNACIIDTPSKNNNNNDILKILNKVYIEKSVIKKCDEGIINFLINKNLEGNIKNIKDAVSDDIFDKIKNQKLVIFTCENIYMNLIKNDQEELEINLRSKIHSFYYPEHDIFLFEFHPIDNKDYFFKNNDDFIFPTITIILKPKKIFNRKMLSTTFRYHITRVPKLALVCLFLGNVDYEKKKVIFPVMPEKFPSITYPRKEFFSPRIPNVEQYEIDLENFSYNFSNLFKKGFINFRFTDELISFLLIFYNKE